MGSHALDLICWWLGAKPEVIASETDSFGGYEAMAALKLKYENCLATVRLSRLSKLPNTYCIRGRSGMIQGGVYESSKITLKVNGQQRQTRSQTETPSMADIGPRLVRNFLNVLAGLEGPLVPADQVIPSIELIDEAYRTAKRISLPWYDWIPERTDKCKTVEP
jgi:predicted dehydrogenase